MRHTIYTVLFLALCGCSSNGTDGLLVTATKQILNKNEPATSASGNKLTRKRINELNVAMMRVQAPKTGLRYVALAKQARLGRVSYLAPNQVTVVMHGGLIVATRGLGHDFAAPATQPNDPIVAMRPVSSWPSAIDRQYELAGRGPVGKIADVRCNFTVGSARTIEIVERLHRVLVVEESCTGDGLSFKNAHLVDERSGYIWQSSQWTGVLQGQVNYEILEPLDSR